MKMKIYMLVVLWLMVYTINGQGVVFEARVSEQVVDQYSSVEVQFTVNANGKDFSPPSIKGLEVVSGPLKSLSQQYVNGKGSTRLTYTYVLLAKKVGSYTIYPATIRVAGQEYSTQPIEIKVVPAAFPTDDSADKDYFIKLVYSDTVAYVGQQIQAYYKLYSTLDVGGLQEVSGPTFDDFYVGEMGANSMGAKKEVIAGKTYYSRIIKGMYLIPQKDGVFDIDETIINMEVYPPGSNRGFFRRGGKRVSVIVPPSRITVHNLPKGAPTSFSGAVGKYTFKSQIASRSITTDDAINMMLFITGNGDEQSVTAPKQPDYDLLESYAPTTGQESRTKGTEGIVMTKSYEYNYVPKGEGRVVLRPEFSYFDVDSSRYITLYADSAVVDIRQGQGKKSAIEDFGTIAASDTTPTDESEGFPWWMLGVGALLLGGLGYFMYSKRSKGGTEAVVERKNPKVVAVSRLKNAKTLLDDKKHDAYFTELSLSLNQYMEDKYHITNSDRSIDYVRTMLKEKQVSEKEVEECTTIMKRCEMALYARQSDKDMSQLYDRTLDLIQRMED